MRFMRSEVKTRKDKIRNQAKFRWLGCVKRICENKLIRQIFEVKEIRKNKRERPIKIVGRSTQSGKKKKEVEGNVEKLQENPIINRHRKV